MNKHLVLSALFVASLGFSVAYTQNEVEKKDQPEVQAFTQELEKRLADVTSKADLKALIEETKEFESQGDKLEQTSSCEFLKLAVLGAVEGLAFPIAVVIKETIGEKTCNIIVPIFFFTTLSGAISKSLTGRIGSLPKAKLSDFLTRSELLKTFVAGVVQVGLGYGLLIPFRRTS